LAVAAQRALVRKEPAAPYQGLELQACVDGDTRPVPATAGPHLSAPAAYEPQVHHET
jgi:hypothetical protein